MIVVHASLTFPTAEAADLMIDAFKSVRISTLKESGCLTYEIGRDVTQPAAYRLSEQWRSLDDLKDHFASPHMAEFRDAVGRSHGRLEAMDVLECGGEIAFEL